LFVRSSLSLEKQQQQKTFRTCPETGHMNGPTAAMPQVKTGGESLFCWWWCCWRTVRKKERKKVKERERTRKEKSSSSSLSLFTSTSAP
jgi:hypothetical protein